MSRTSGNKLKELLKRWLSGDTGRREEALLEALAGDDDFLAEALEGYRRFPEGDHQQRIEGLKKKIEERSRKKRTTVFYLSRIAAVLAFVVIAGAGIHYLSQSSSGLAMDESLSGATESATPPAGEYALEEALPPETTSSDQAQLGDLLAAEDSEESNEPLKEAARTDNFSRLKPSAPDTRAQHSQPPRVATAPAEEAAGAAAPSHANKARQEQTVSSTPLPDSFSLYADGVPLTSGEEPPAEAEMEIETAEEMVTVPATRPASRTDEIAAEAAPAPPQADVLNDNLASKEVLPLSRNIRGQVRDENGEPLIGVNVLVPNTSLGTITDFDGNFELQVDSSVQQLEFAYVGFDKQKQTLGSNDQLEVQLQASDMALDEVVVSGYRNKAKSKKKSSFRPENGLKKYRKYIRENLNYPEAAKEAGIEGEVTVEFLIGSEGQARQIRILRSLGYGCDEEAIRLIREGPAWKGTGQTATYTIRFEE